MSSLRFATISLHGLTFAMAAVLLFMLTLAIASACGGCTPQASGQWPPTVAFESAHVSGQLVLATPGGPITIDLSTGMVSGSGDVEVVSSTIGADVAVQVNGLRQWVRVDAPGHRDGAWVQCVAVQVAAEVSPGAVLEWASPMMCPGQVAETVAGSGDAPIATP